MPHKCCFGPGPSWTSSTFYRLAQYYLRAPLGLIISSTLTNFWWIPSKHGLSMRDDYQLDASMGQKIKLHEDIALPNLKPQCWTPKISNSRKFFFAMNAPRGSNSIARSDLELSTNTTSRTFSRQTKSLSKFTSSQASNYRDQASIGGSQNKGTKLCLKITLTILTVFRIVVAIYVIAEDNNDQGKSKVTCKACKAVP